MRPATAVIPILLAFMLSAVGPAAGAPLGADPVEAQLVFDRSVVRAGETVHVMVRLRMEDGWYVYGPEKDGSGLPTTVQWILPEGFRAGPLQWPPPQRIEIQGVVTHGYQADLMLLAEIAVPAGLSPGSQVFIGAEVGWLACRNECVPGKASLSVELSIAAGASRTDPSTAALFAEARTRLAGASGTASAAASGTASAPAPEPVSIGLLLALVLAFTGGILLNLMPCVFPVLSLKVMAVARQSGADRGKILVHGLWYAAGVLVSFWAIAAILLALRSGGRLLGWGFQFQEPATAAAAAVVFFLLGLNLFGVYEVGSGLGGAGTAARSKAGWFGSFAGGLFTTVVATPCSAPFMGTALGYAVAQPPAVSMAVFSALGLGLAAPFVLLSAWPGLAARLPKPGRWMETLRNVLAFPLMATVVWMAWIVAAQTDAGTVVALLGALLASAAGAWVWGRWGGLDRGRGIRAAAAAAAIVLAAGGLGFAVGTASVAASGTASVAASGTASLKAPAEWEAWSPGRLAQARAEGKTVFVDFTAQWCLTCRVNEGTTLSNRKVRERFLQMGVVLLKADWTNRDDGIASALAGLGRVGVPVYALYARGAPDPVLLPEILTPGIVLEALERAR